MSGGLGAGRVAALAAAALSLPAGRAEANRPDAALGPYHVTVFLPESDGSGDESLEDWTEAMEEEVVDQVLEACLFWADAAPDWAELSFHVTYFPAAEMPTSVEPITRPGGEPLLGFWGGDEDRWINDMMDVTGHSSTWLFYYQEVEDFNDDAQAEHGTEEAFSAFVVNSLNDEDGKFSNDKFAYVPELRAPYLVMTWDNDGWRDSLGSEALRLVGAHEMSHLFGAEDEYADSNSSCSDVSNGYATSNHEECPDGAETSCLMRQNRLCGYYYPYPLCYWTRGQVGWDPACPPSGICGLLGPWECATVRQCVDGSRLCDGSRDCDDASDELGCHGCGDDEYRCDTMECVASFDICECADDDFDGYRDAACGGDDCDDGSSSVHPLADESCNEVDDDCDGEVDEPFDFDRDGFATCGARADCNDHHDGIYPGAPERCGDGIDQDCSGEDLACDCPDEDGDGLADHACGGPDCDDGDPAVGRSWPSCGSEPGCDGGSCSGPGDGGPGDDGAGCACAAAGRRARPAVAAFASSFIGLLLQRGARLTPR